MAELGNTKTGTKVKITEIHAANGFIKEGMFKETAIEHNKIIEITWNY